MKLHIRHLWIALIVAAILFLVATVAIGVRGGI